MKTKNVLVMVIVLAIVLVFAISCNEEPESGSTELQIVLENRSMGSRTMMPSDALMEIRKYSVSGQGPSGQTFGPIVTTENNATVTGISTGNWTIQAKALNAENNELASGTGDFNLVRGKNSVTLELDTISGTGTFQLDLSWDPDITWHESLRFDVSIEDPDGTVLTSVSRETATDSDGISILITLAAGCHIINVRVFDSDGSLNVGATDAIRIVSGVKTAGSLHFSPSAPETISSAMSIGLENHVGIPMEFFIDYSPKNVREGQMVTLHAVCDSLPSGVSSSDLSYQWYKDGVQTFSGSGGTYSVLVQSGIHRYDVIVDSDKAGTMCGASLLMNVSD